MMTDSQFAKSFGWMIFLLLVLTIVLIIVGAFIGGSIDDKLQAQSKEFTQRVVAQRTKPVGELKIGKIQLASAAPMPAKATAPASTQPEPSETQPADEGELQLANLEIGKTVYTGYCYICHNTGVNHAPLIGDLDDWRPRIAQGLDVLYEHSIRGFESARSVMPPKGGNLLITDDETRAAVNYMVSVSR